MKTKLYTWTTVLNDLLGGIAHALNNRVAAIIGISDILSHSPDATRVKDALADEVLKLDHAVRMLQTLIAPDSEAVEATEAADPNGILQLAMALLEYHPRVRGTAYTVPSTPMPPVLIQPSVFVREILVLLANAATEPTPSAITVVWTPDGDMIRITTDDRSDRADRDDRAEVRARMLRPPSA